MKLNVKCPPRLCRSWVWREKMRLETHFQLPRHILPRTNYLARRHIIYHPLHFKYMVSNHLCGQLSSGKLFKMSETSWGLEARRDLSSNISSHIWELLLSKIFFSPNIHVPIETHALIPGMISLTKNNNNNSIFFFCFDRRNIK